MKNNNIIDKIVHFFDRFKIFKPLVSLYDKYREVWLYLFFGFLTTVINFLVYEVFTKLFDVKYSISNVIAWILSVTFAYIVDRNIVFESQKNKITDIIKEIVLFFGARIMSLIIDMILMYIGVELLLVNDTVVKIISNIVVIIVNYLISKLIVFNRRKKI